MARPERNTVDYFPHLFGEGKKMFFIEQKYKNDGYATWYKILEKLGDAQYHYLDLNNEEEIMFLAAKCHIPEEKLISIINDLTRMKVFDKELWEIKIIWSQQFIDSVQDAYKKRNNKCITIEGLRILLVSFGILKPSKSESIEPENTQRREEDTKVKESKEKNIPPLSEFLDYVSEKSKNFEEIKYAAELKYNAWVENGWKDGHDKKIKNWKSKILNTIPFLGKEKNSAQKESKMDAYKRVHDELNIDNEQ